MNPESPDPEIWIRRLEESGDFSPYERSARVLPGGDVLFAGRRAGSRWMAFVRRRRSDIAPPDRAERQDGAGSASEELYLTPWSPETAAWIRRNDPGTSPGLFDGRPSFGFGDRLARATPGHVRALGDAGWFPVFAQQSIREMTRTGRTPQEVMDDALWGCMVEGFRGAFGADADHLKTEEDVRRCVDAGFRMFTIDPGDHVDDRGATASGTELEEAFRSLPWEILADRPEDCLARYVNRSYPGEGPVRNGEVLMRAAVKYGRAVAHTAALARRLDSRLGRDRYDLEMSVDETDSPTSALEHYYIASELLRLGIRPASLAPRFVGRFEKGIDYIGNPSAFEESLRWHAAVAREFGAYRISFHSGSDKFSVYPIARRILGDALHVKTAGTSYLEAVRALSRTAPDLFRSILEIARARYDIDKATYHVSAAVERLPRDADLADEDLPALLDDDNARQILHVTYGSIVGANPVDPAVRERFFDALDEHEDEHWSCLETHLRRHLQALSPREANR